MTDRDPSDPDYEKLKELDALFAKLKDQEESIRNIRKFSKIYDEMEDDASAARPL